jgi:MYXO-CTERM domain-containing protein
MHRPPSHARARLALASLFFALIALLAPGLALAAGTVTVGNTSPQESSSRWKLNMTIDYGSVPHLAHVPMVFSFEPTALYERSLTDKSPEKPVITTVPLKNQQGINVSMEVGFSDATGKTHKITKFDVSLKRDNGFEAGEYTMTIRTSDGVKIGSPVKLKLMGDNPVIDRRAISFVGDGKKKPDAKKDEPKADEPKPEPSSDEPKADEPKAEPAASADPPPAVAPKQGGCGCRLEGEGDARREPLYGLAGLALVGLFLARRRA